MFKAIVFGANGYLGRHMSFYLKKMNFYVIPIDYSIKSIDNYLNYKKADITKKDELKIIDFNVDYIFVFAGLTGTNIGFEKYKEFIEVNEIGLLNILSHYTSSKSKARIIFPSSRLVYKGKKNITLNEESKKDPKTIYALNKLAGERYLRIYQNYFNINYTIFRICVPYGNIFSNDYSYGTIGFFISRANNGENIVLYGDGNIKRTFTHVMDICEKIFFAIQHKGSNNNVFNIGGEDKSLMEVASEIAVKYNVNILFAKWPESAQKLESGNTIFNANKIHHLIGDKYKYRFREWIKQIN